MSFCLHAAAIADDVARGPVTYAREASNTPRDGGRQRAGQYVTRRHTRTSLPVVTRPDCDFGHSASRPGMALW